MDEALELARAKDTKERMAGVERLHQLLGASRKSLSSSEVAALVDCCMDLLKDNNFRVSQGALQALASATVLSGDLLKLHFNALVPAVVERLGNAKQPVRDAARRLLLTLMEADVDNSGAIDYGEFIAASVHLNKQEREELLVAAFRYIDKDFSGYITVDELQQACAEHNMADITSKRQNSNLEDPLDAELQKIADMVTSDNMEEELQFTHSAKIIEDLTIVGDGDMFDASDEFLSLTTKVYENREDLICDVRRIGLVQGFVVVIKRSRPNKGNVTLGCDRGGSYKTRVADENKKNNSSSRLINCPFEIMGRKKAEGMWKVEIVTLLHNHAQSTNMSGHPYCRRFSEEEAKQLKQMDRAGIKPRQILSSLRQNNPNLLAVSRNVYSKTAQFRKESLGGRSVIRALLDELGEAGFTHNVKHDHYGNLTHLFFAHPTSIELTKSYPNVFVMDCTYKTNKYKMPLLEIIGVSSFNKSFYSCFVFLQKEEQEDYEWAMEMFSKLLGVGDHTLTIVTDRELALMNAIEVVFPQSSNLLCIWHINKNIAAHCKGHFKDDADWVVFMSSWAALVKSWNVSLFTEAWNNLQVEYNGFPEVLSYIENTWLPWKEKFVFAWTGQISHFGNSVTSRTEGAHATLKRYLEVSRGGLREVKEKVCLAIENQFQEFKTQLENEKIRVPHKLYIPFFKETVNKVSFHALFEVHKQYVLANTKDYSTLCKGQFYKTMGLPCVHMIKEKNLEVLPLNQIHKQWRIDTRSFDNDHHASLVQEDPLTCLLSDIRQKYEKQPLVQKESTRRQLSQILSASSPLIFEPTIQPHKGRPVGAANKRKETSSTRREPSLFEIVEKTPRKCSRCGNIGHYKNKCQSINNSVDLGTQ